MQPLSEFERKAITALAADDRQGDIVLAQLSHASCESRDYTGVGLYTNLAITADVPLLDKTRWRIEDMLHLSIEHPAVPAGVGLILWVKDGFIKCLESYTYDGNWPRDESLFQFSS